MATEANHWQREEMAKVKQVIEPAADPKESVPSEEPPTRQSRPNRPPSIHENPPAQGAFISESDNPKLVETPPDIPEPDVPRLDRPASTAPVAPEVASILAEAPSVTSAESHGDSGEIVEPFDSEELPEQFNPVVFIAEPGLIGGMELETISDHAETPAAEIQFSQEAVFSNEIFADEIMDTFEQLLEYAAAEQEAFPDDLEAYEPLAENQVILFSQETSGPAAANAFEAFVAAQPNPEVAPDIATIIAVASEQKLEETFVQLSLYLTEAFSSSENAVLEQVLREVVELLPGDTAGHMTKAEEANVTITPELTQKLFTLLEAVGYPDPREALFVFVGDHDITFLMQAIRYLHQLCDDNNRREFLSNATLNFSATNVKEPLAIRLGRAIVNYSFSYKVASGV